MAPVASAPPKSWSVVRTPSGGAELSTVRCWRFGPVVYWLWLLLKHSGHVLPAVVSSKSALDLDSGVCPDSGWARRTESARLEVEWNTAMNTTGMEHYIHMCQ